MARRVQVKMSRRRRVDEVEEIDIDDLVGVPEVTTTSRLRDDPSASGRPVARREVPTVAVHYPPPTPNTRSNRATTRR